MAMRTRARPVLTALWVVLFALTSILLPLAAAAQPTPISYVALG